MDEYARRDRRPTPRNKNEAARDLAFMRAVVAWWASADLRQRTDAGLTTQGDTHIVSPPYWPTHGQLGAWTRALDRAGAILATDEKPAGLFLRLGSRSGLHIDRAYGLAWLRIGRNVLSLRAPWLCATFSEREGLRRPLVKLLGWRLFYTQDAAQHASDTREGEADRTQDPTTPASPEGV